jgi:hypothetical protein
VDINDYYTSIGQSQSPGVAKELQKRKEEEKKGTAKTQQDYITAVGQSQSPEVADTLVKQAETTRQATPVKATTRQPVQPLTPQQAAYARVMSQPIQEQARREMVLDYQRKLTDPMYGYLVGEAQRKLQAQAQASRPEFVDPTISELVKSGTVKLKNEVKLIEKYKQDTGGYDLPNYLRDNPNKKDVLKAYFNPADVDKAAEVAKLPESLYSFKERYYKEKGWKDLDKKSLTPREEGPALRKDAMQIDEVRREYIKKYGEKAYAGSIAGKTLSFVFSPARALSPDVTIKDISKGEWITGAAQVALFVVAPTVSMTARGVGGAVASKTIQLGAGAVFLKDTVTHWKDMTPTERVISVSMDTLIIGSALPKRAILKLAKASGKYLDESVEITLKRWKAEPERGSYVHDPKPVDDIIKAVESRGDKLTPEFKTKIHEAAKQVTAAGQSASITGKYGEFIDAVQNMKSLAKDITNPYARQEYENIMRRVSSNPKDALKTAEKITEKADTAKVIENNKKLIDDLDDIAKGKPTEQTGKKFDPYAASEKDIEEIIKKPSRMEEYNKIREAEEKAKAVQKAAEEEAKKQAIKEQEAANRRFIEELKKKQQKPEEPSSGGGKPKEEMTDDKGVRLSTRDKLKKWWELTDEEKEAFNKGLTEQEKKVLKKEADVALKEKGDLANQLEFTESEKKALESIKEKEGLTQVDKETLKKIKEERTLEKFAKELNKEESQKKLVAEKKVAEEFKQRQAAKEKSEAETKAKQEAEKKKTEEIVKTKEELRQKIQETQKQKASSLADVNREIREELKRIREQKPELEREIKVKEKEVSKVKEDIKQVTKTETKTQTKTETKTATKTKTKLKEKLKEDLKLKLEQKQELEQKLKTLLKQKTGLNQQLKNNLSTQTKLSLETDTKLKQVEATKPDVTKEDYTKKYPEPVIENDKLPEDGVKPPPPPPPPPPTDKIIKPPPPPTPEDIDKPPPPPPTDRPPIIKGTPQYISVVGKKRTAAEIANAVTWKQGIGYWIVYPDNSAEFSRTKPDGVREVPGPDKNKPGATIQVYKPKPGGRIRQTTGDMGIQDVTISRQGIKPVGIRFKGDRKQQTNNPVKFGKHRSIKKNHVYYTRIGRGDIISREPLQ